MSPSNIKNVLWVQLSIILYIISYVSNNIGWGNKIVNFIIGAISIVLIWRSIKDIK